VAVHEVHAAIHTAIHAAIHTALQARPVRRLSSHSGYRHWGQAVLQVRILAQYKISIIYLLGIVSGVAGSYVVPNSN
jgi:hypothetical protein